MRFKMEDAGGGGGNDASDGEDALDVFMCAETRLGYTRWSYSSSMMKILELEENG